MKTTLVTFLGIFISISLFSQSLILNKSDLQIINREVVLIGDSDQTNGISFNTNEGEGLAIVKNIEFENGTLELDIKGKNNPGRSFVGIAFHVQDEKTFNAIYFRPFNFKSQDKVRSGHSVQYVCHPEFSWHKLRGDFPEEFENPVNPIPDPDEYFHAKVVVEWPMVSVFVEDATEPSLKIKMKSEFKKGKLGFWVGNGSDGEFKNLVVTNK